MVLCSILNKCTRCLAPRVLVAWLNQNRTSLTSSWCLLPKCSVAWCPCERCWSCSSKANFWITETQTLSLSAEASPRPLCGISESTRTNSNQSNPSPHSGTPCRLRMCKNNLSFSGRWGGSESWEFTVLGFCTFYPGTHALLPQFRVCAYLWLYARYRKFLRQLCLRRRIC